MAIACAPAEHMTAGAGPPSPAVGHSSGGFDSAGDLISRNLMRRRQEQQQRQQQLQSQQAEGEHGGELFGLQQKTFPLGPAPNAPAVQVCWILGCTEYGCVATLATLPEMLPVLVLCRCLCREP